MNLAISIKKNELAKKTAGTMTNNLPDKNINEKEKWVYFAIARQWRKVEADLFS